MTARIIDGKAFAAKVRGQVAGQVTRLSEDHGLTPGLAVVLVGEDPASEVYVRNKGKQTVECGMASFEHKLDARTSEAELLALIAQLNADPAVHGILVQLPLPDHLNEDLVINAISAGLQGEMPALPDGLLAEGAVAYDMVYGNEPTPFLRWAETRSTFPNLKRWVLLFRRSNRI